MIAALSLLLILTLAVLVVRTGAVALRLTGMPEHAARFQARSAFTGTGFTTSESESIVNHPVRRRIASVLMVIGSLGLISVLSTVIVSLVDSSGSGGGIFQQLLWLAAVLAVLWCVALNPKADRIMCGAIGRLLERTQGFGARKPMCLLQMSDGHSVIQIPVHRGSGLAGQTLGGLACEGVALLGLQREDGTYFSLPDSAKEMRLGDEIFLYGADDVLGAMKTKRTVPEAGNPGDQGSA